MFLFIARHAWAGEHGDPRWPDDSLRELTPEGIDRYVRVVTVLADRGFAPDRIATSPFKRCRQTADIIAALVAGRSMVDELDALQPGSDLEALLNWSHEHSQNDENLCWVGHSPDVEWLTSALIGDGNARIRFAKGTVAAIGFDDEIDAGAGDLTWLATAKSLGV